MAMSRSRMICISIPMLMLFVFAASDQEHQAVAVLEGLSLPQGIAAAPQSSPFVTNAGGQITHILNIKTADVLTKTGGTLEGITSHAAGDLYIADVGRKVILKVTQWGTSSVFANSCRGEPIGHPARLAVVGDASIYFTDAATGRLCRDDRHGGVIIVASDFGNMESAEKMRPLRYSCFLRSFMRLWTFSRVSPFLSSSASS
jgi:hypothetical protein